MTTKLGPPPTLDLNQDPSPQFEGSAETTDHDLFRSMAIGACIGTPLTFAVGVVICVLALGLSHLGDALPMASVAALFGGFYVGGLVPLLRADERHERNAKRSPREMGAPAAVRIPAGSGRVGTTSGPQ